ncbi:hypothetical protein PH562_20435 [Rhizobium sp. CNPSo 4062]|uniref:hypothetical protein n=1 Tax=Rhizobium sp. CNPSo 4062 TaxID=3021410 RepID=UPI00254D2093|nr:hypothetical protein [Rhizobium sp. CNPSo 4062]MDK4704633.1 hypothetical protein [Rhizobium sp. CNPSo 4062]
MASKGDLQDWVVDALRSNKGSASILYVAQHIWENHEKDLAGSPLFYSWQYDMRWAATELRKKGLLVAAGDDRRGKWTLK